MLEFLNGRVVLYGGDCRDVIRTLPDNSLDAIVSDPPYALVSIVKRYGAADAAPAIPKEGSAGVYSRSTRGFMGKQWDTGEAAFAAEFWAECLRVLKPGGHVAAFSGTRTYHRLACAIEDAGFEIRDQLAWTYGCLTDDAEILTADGWRLGVDVQPGEMVAAWNSETGRISLAPVQKKTLAPWRGDLVRFVNDDTDQLLTPNHRVYHRSRVRLMRDGVRKSKYPQEYAVSEASEINRWNNVQLPMAGEHDGPGIGGEDMAALLGWVWTEGGFDTPPSTGVRIYQSESANPEKVAEIDALVSRAAPEHKRYDRERTYTHAGQSRSYTETCWFFTGQAAQKVRDFLPGKSPSWALLWAMTLSEKKAFYRSAMMGDGSGDDFYQKKPEDLVWFQALVAMIGMRGKICMRKAPRDGGAVCITPRATTELQGRHLKNASEFYDGPVWCVKVETGAFVARRKGKVFITGNSGFPKSHNISKAIDKAAGAAREVIGAVQRTGSAGAGKTVAQSGGQKTGVCKITVPATDDAKRAEGYGTALKPAWEPIALARKALAVPDGNGGMRPATVAENFLHWGTGALYIDGCRIGSEVLPAATAGQARLGTFERSDMVTPEREGRYPANILHDGSAEVVDCFPEGAARFFYSAKADGEDRVGSNHPTVKPVDLMQWLCRLITPPGGTLLDPFAGTGTTGEAAFREGFRAVLIEREEEYQADIARRMKLALAGPEEKSREIIKAKGEDKPADDLPLFAT